MTERRHGDRRTTRRRAADVEPTPAPEPVESSPAGGAAPIAPMELPTDEPGVGEASAPATAPRISARDGGARGSAGRARTGSQGPPLPDLEELRRLLAGEHGDPHSILGAHPMGRGGKGIVVRAMHPAATSADCVLEDGGSVPMQSLGGGVFHAGLPDATFPIRYRVRFHFPDGGSWERGEPYRFAPTLGDVDLHLFNEGTHRRLWEKLGAHPMTMDGVDGVAFAVWAPNARRVSVVGDFCQWDGRIYPMRRLGSSGVWELFIPEIGEGALYKYELLTREGVPRVKSDPFAIKLEQSPGTASIIQRTDRYEWNDDEWMAARGSREMPREPVLIYEVHLGSWARVPEEGNRSLTYREIAPRLAEHVKTLGFTHIELLPISEHPFTGSWGYQVSGYYAPTSRHGTPDDFRHFVDTLHQAGIGVILDWVPAHFPKDDFALRRFDGTALYEHEDPRLGEHPDWGTLIFNYARKEVRNFLTANALYWLGEFHVDGLRVDAVASMLYLDYSRKAGQWLRNRLGGRENLDAIEFLREVNELVRIEQPGCMTIAEESTAWPGVTKSPHEGGLGFTFKWNMGWMHDTLAYFATDPLYRRHHQDQLTFAMLYEYSERFIMPLSHDEVVHLKGSLLDKMPGDAWQKFANLRVMLAYQYTRPGKKLLFMGMEVGQWSEWNHDSSVQWHFAGEPLHRGLLEYLRELGALYRAHPALWRRDPEPEGFSWIDVADKENSVLSYVRRDGAEHVVTAVNLTPVPREDYRIGAPAEGRYRVVLTSDDRRFGGGGWAPQELVHTEPSPFHGFPQSMRLNLPPLGAVILVPERGRA
jgi:1,4-alpha-glucan branching enzyme